MAGESNFSIFGGRGGFGNRGRQFSEGPAVVPPSRAGIDYTDQRANGTLPPSNVFKETGYADVEPSVLRYDLSVARTDLEIPVSGNLIWFQSSTNTTDIITLKFERVNAVGIPFQPGNKLGGIPFSKLYMTNAAIAGAVGFLILLKDSPASPVSIL